MGANQSSSNTPGPPQKKSRPQQHHRPPSFTRRTSLDLNRLSITPLNAPARKQPSQNPSVTPPGQSPAPRPTEGTSASDARALPAVDPMHPSQPPTTILNGQDATHSAERSSANNDSIIHSSIPLGITPPSESGALQSGDDTENSEVPTSIVWRGGGTSVLLAGTFISGWRGRIPMVADPSSAGVFTVQISLPPGPHRLKFIVDDQWRCADDLPTATDNDGHLVNYIEVVPGGASWDPSAVGTASETSRASAEFGDAIPPHLLHSALLEEQYLSRQSEVPPTVPHPATLPRHLEKVILNPTRHSSRSERTVSEDPRRDDNSVLPIPNHVVLNHLGTSAIKNGVLAVATTMRYQQKYISTLYFKPVAT